MKIRWTTSTVLTVSLCRQHPHKLHIQCDIFVGNFRKLIFQKSKEHEHHPHTKGHQ